MCNDKVNGNNTVLAQANHISEEVNSCVTNAIDIFVKTAKESIYNAIGDRLKNLTRRPPIHPSMTTLRTKSSTFAIN